MVLHLNKLESPKVALLNLVEICPAVLKKQIFKFRQCIFAITKLSPLEKGPVLQLNKLESPSPKMLCAKFGWNCPVVKEKKIF